MRNPFLSNGFVMPVASINSVKIMGLGNLPINPSIVNKTAKDLLCAETVSSLMSQFFQKNNLDSQYPFKTLENLIENGDSEIRIQANEVLKTLGYNLGYVLLALKRGDSENKSARSNWDDSHWEYWKSLSKIELGGGLVQGKFGKKMLEYTNELFEKLGITPYETTISRNGNILPLIGAARYASLSCDSVAFDFGHSYIKSTIIKRGTKPTLFIQDKIKAQHVTGDNDDEQYSISDALALNQFIINTIMSALDRAVLHIDITKTTNIAISIANYISGGHIAQRGSYRKLSLVADNYESYLTAKISHLSGVPLSVKLIHDSTSAAIASKTSGSDSAVITMGTSLGVGFTDSIGDLPSFEYVLA